MNALNKKFLIAALATVSILAFQNCAQKGFTSSDASLNQKLEADGAASTDGAVSADIEVRTEADLACGDVNRHVQWILRDAFVAGKAIAVPGDYKFVFKIHKNELPKTKVCAGDCGRAYKMNLHSFSGPLHLEYTCRFNEAKSVFESKIYSTFDAIEAATHGGNDLFHELDRTFAGALRGAFTAAVSADRKEMKLNFANGDVLVFVLR